MAKRLRAACQLAMGLVHRLEMFLKAKNISFVAASSEGKAPRVLMIFLRDRFIDSMTLVV
jgi:hypothetical protein